MCLPLTMMITILILLKPILDCHFKMVRKCTIGPSGLVVRDSSSRGRGIESQHQVLDEHLLHYIVLNRQCLFEKTENKRQGGRGWHLLYL